MKTKLEMAHDYAMLHMMNSQYKDVDDLEMVQWAFDYADAMQAEVDKREQEKQDKLKQDQQNHHDELVSIGLEEWQPDWSQAPEWANWWVATADRNGKISGGWFYDAEPDFGESKGVSIYYSSNSNCILTDSFGYTGNWRDSLRKRPN